MQNQHVTGHLAASLAVSRADYKLDPTLEPYAIFTPPLGGIPAAQRSAKVATELAKRTSHTSDPVRAQKMKTLANVLWDQWRQLLEAQMSDDCGLALCPVRG